MRTVLYIAPVMAGNSVRCLKALADLDGVKIGVISQQPAEAIPAPLRPFVAGHQQVKNCLDSAQLIEAASRFKSQWGTIHRMVGFLEQLQIPMAIARDAVKINGHTETVARNFREKNRMKAVLRDAGLPVARQALIFDGPSALAFANRVGFPMVVKPPAGVGTVATMRVENDAQLLAALQRLKPTKAQPALAEEFITGEEYTFESVVLNGRPVWTSSSRYLPGPLEVLEKPWIQYCVVLPRTPMEHPAAQQFQELNRRALKALGIRHGITHMEWFLRPDGTPVISEVGCRPPGVRLMPMMGYAHGVDMWSKWIELEVKRTFTIPERQWAMGTAFFRGQGHGNQVVNVSGVAEAQRLVTGRVVAHQLPQVGMKRSTHYEGEGWCTVRGETTQEVWQALKDLVTTVRVELGAA